MELSISQVFEEITRAGRIVIIEYTDSSNLWQNLTFYDKI